MQDFPSGTSIRGNKTDRLGVFVAPFPISGSSPSDDDDMTVKQPPCRQDAILFLLCVHQTIILSRKHLFFNTLLSLPVGYMVKKCRTEPFMTVSEFYFRNFILNYVYLK